MAFSSQFDSGSEISVAFGVEGYAAMVSLDGEHDLATREAVRVALLPLCGRVLVDLTACTFLESTIIETIVAKASDLKRDGYDLAITTSPGSPVASLLELVSVGDVVRIIDTPGSAPPA